MKKRIAIVIFLALLVGVALLVYFGQWKTKQTELYYSGTIDARQSNLAFQAGGRVRSVLVDEGQAVQAGQVLAELDSAEFQSRYEQAQANLDRAEKGKQQLETMLEVYRKTLPADVARAEAGKNALKAQLDELRAGSRIQDLQRANQAVLAAQAVMDDAKKNRDRIGLLFAKGVVSDKDNDAANLKYETSLRDYERAKETYDLLKEGARPETIRSAEARLAEAEAVRRQAQSNLKKIDATVKEIEGAKSAVQAARAVLGQAAIQLTYVQLKAPFAGIITSRDVEPGEVVNPSRECLSLADLSRVDLKIFVPETEIGKVRPGQKATVKIDTFPGRDFPGVVTFVSPEGEFTPKMIQTKKERVKIVYLVKVSIPNPSLELKSGMPADAWLE
ncbi:MAG: efflux RND transporter periplasmic adaptor subunit [Smithellaceae bacterium]|nr:efflux RND transporter periplasmic adaptor subunit [Smithellaceae bacterium]